MVRPHMLVQVRNLLRPVSQGMAKLPKAPRPDDKSYKDRSDCHDKLDHCKERTDDYMEPLKNRRMPAVECVQPCEPRVMKSIIPVECPPVPEPKRRPRRPVSKSTGGCDTALKSKDGNGTNMAAAIGSDTKCPKVASLFCPPLRNPLTCKTKHKDPPPCFRVPNPLPSFTECKKAAILPLPPTECRCFDRKPTCSSEREKPWEKERPLGADR